LRFVELEDAPRRQSAEETPETQMRPVKRSQRQARQGKARQALTKRQECHDDLHSKKQKSV